MNCDKYNEMISALIDDEIEESSKKSLIGHIDNCSRCRKEYNRQMELRKAMREDCVLSMPVSLETKILEITGLKAEGGGSKFDFLRGSYHIPRPVAWAAMVVLIILAANTIFIEQNNDKREIPERQSGDIQTIMLTDADIVSISTEISQTSNRGGPK